jgi:capsid protein
MAKRPASKLAQRAEAARHRADIAEQNNRAAAARVRGKVLREMAGRVPDLLNPPRPRTAATGRGGQPLAFGGSYENATRTRLRSGSRPPGGAAWAHLDRATRDNLRRDCQGLKRNNVIARLLLNRHTDFIVGDGAVVKPTTPDAKWNAEVARLWNLWADGCDPDLLGRPNLRGLTTFWQDCRGIVGAWLTEGDRLAVEVLDAEDRVTFQYIPAERVINSGGAYMDSPGMVGGVEMDARGAVAAYHVGEWDRSGSGVRLVGTHRVSAESAVLMPNPVGYEEEQVRGEPALQAALDLFEVIDGFILSTAVAAEVATWFAAMIQSERPAEIQSALENAVIDQPDRENSYQQKEVTLAPGEVFYGRPGETIQQLKPEHPTTQFKDFVFSLVQMVGADLGVPMVLALYESGQMSYSNLRGVLAVAARGFEFKQSVLAGYVSWVYRRKVGEWMRRGLVGFRDDWDKHTVKFPPAPVVDFKMEVEGYTAAVEQNFITKGQVVELLGTGVFGDIVSERGAEKKAEEAAGVVPADKPGAQRPGNADPGTQNDNGDTDTSQQEEEPAEQGADE